MPENHTDDLIQRIVSDEIASYTKGSQRLPSQVGGYQILRSLGAGGMGAVFLASRQVSGVTQTVALKLLSVPHWVPNAAESRQRFLRECQILADLEHANIARFLDADTTADGQPYVVMEYIQGQPIDTFCVEHKLDLRARVQLFRQVCAAVAYAHQQLIVHRDLKPANILVRGNGTVSLLDFGIARYLDAKQTSLTELTEQWSSGRALTPGFASPEQIQGEKVGTRSDVYSLGVLLYLLLTDDLPHDLAGMSEAEATRVIAKRSPSRPSLVAKDSVGRDAPGWRQRNRQLRELDSIVMKALRKAPEERYASVERLDADLNRFLSGRPVLAKKGAWHYVIRKFIGRHKWRLAALAVVLVLGISALVDRSIRMQRAALAEEQVALMSSLTGFLLDLADLSAPGGGSNVVDAPDRLSAGLNQLSPQLEHNPETLASFLYLVGAVYQRLGHLDEAESLLMRSIELQRGIDEPNRLAMANAMFQLADLYADRGRVAEAKGLHSEVLAIREQILGPDHLLVADSLQSLGMLVFGHDRSKLAEATPLLARAAAIFQQHIDEAADAQRPGAMPITLGGKFRVATLTPERAGRGSMLHPEHWGPQLNVAFPDAEVTVCDNLIDCRLNSVDVVALSAAAGSFQATTALSDAEQFALSQFVMAGGAALVVTDNKDFMVANDSMLLPFGLRSEGHWPGISVATVSTPASSPVTDGPFGTVAKFVQAYSGGYSNLGPYAVGLASNPVGVALAVIEPGKLGVNSGPVVLFSDSSTPPVLWANAMAYCAGLNP